ncbi:MAG: hypothetical protein ACKORY_11795 [Actinomycetota bacterium]
MASTDQLKLLNRLQEMLGGEEAGTLMGMISGDHSADIVELKTDVAELRADVVGLKADVTWLKLGFTELGTKIGTLSQDINRLEATVLRTMMRHLTFSVSAMLSINTLMVGVVAFLG